ncbi:hypothetical protein LXL04_026217 [Taraxacum kok-saghyz]
MSATATAVSAAEKPVRRFPPPCWTQDEALALIQAYRERWYALRRGYLRTADWDAVAEEVGRLCPGAVPPKTSAQCRHKMEKLRQRYRAEKQRALSFPGGQFLSTWFYFEAMDSMEKNGSGSNPDEETQSGNDLKIVNSKKNHQSNANIDSIYGGLNPGRGIRFKPVAADNTLVTIATRSNNFRVSQSYDAQEEDNENEEELEDEYFIEPPIVKNSGKPHKSSTQSYATRFQSDHHSNNGVHVHPSNFQELQHSGTRPRKFSKTASNSNPSYWTENGQEDDNDDGEDEVWVKMPKDRGSAAMDFRDNKYGDRNSTHHYLNGEDDFSREKRGVKRDNNNNNNNSIGQIVSSIKLLADGFVKMEKMKMDMIHEIEKTRMEAEMKRNELLLESQKQIVEAFVKEHVEEKPMVEVVEVVELQQDAGILGAVCLGLDSDSDSDHGLGLSPTSPIKRLGPRTESDIRGNICRKSLRFFWADRVRRKRSDRVRGPSLTDIIKRTDHGPSPWSESESSVRALRKQPLTIYTNC